jgi:hypothetical protein
MPTNIWIRANVEVNRPPTTSYLALGGKERYDVEVDWSVVNLSFSFSKKEREASLVSSLKETKEEPQKSRLNYERK